MTTYAVDSAGTVEVLRELADPEHTAHVLHEVFQEREAQERKWGQQNHPNGTGPNRMALGKITPSPVFNDTLRDLLRSRCDHMHQAGYGTFEQILTEEWAEAISEFDPRKLRKELIQVAAVATAWVEKLDREAGV